MIVSVFGASGRTGKALIPMAAEAGIVQRLHYRSAPAEPTPDTATVVVGALADPTAVREVLRGAEAVILLLGHKTGETRAFAAAATKAIIAGMRTQEVPRILCVTGAMIGESSGNVGVTLKMLAFAARRSSQADVLQDRDNQERLVRNSKLSWTLIKPPRLVDGPAADVDAGPSVSLGMNSQCSRASLARFLVQEAMQPQFTEQAIYIKHR